MQRILELIENVNPADKDALDEIDASVFKYLQGEDRGDTPPCYLRADGRTRKPHAQYYTRSRDALKSIRPEGWVFTIDSRGGCRLFNPMNCNAPNFSAQNNDLGFLPTEELAELHAIIQVIQWERTCKTT